jgi:hypothetical protein
MCWGRTALRWLRARHRIGVAVNTDKGLLVPNIKDVSAKSVLQVHGDLMELIDRAQANRSIGRTCAGRHLHHLQRGRHRGHLLRACDAAAISALGEWPGAFDFLPCQLARRARAGEWDLDRPRLLLRGREQHVHDPDRKHRRHCCTSAWMRHCCPRWGSGA